MIAYTTISKPKKNNRIADNIPDITTRCFLLVLSARYPPNGLNVTPTIPDIPNTIPINSGVNA